MIDVIIVNWNSGPLLGDCLQSVMQYGHGLVTLTVVVDNQSSDGSDACIVERPEVKLIRAETNLGFGKACNLGSLHVKSDYILFLNPDAKLAEESLRGAMRFLQDPMNSKVGICGVQLLDEKGQIAHSCARFPTVSSFLARATGVDRAFPSCGYLMADWDHGHTRDVDHVIGAFFLVRRQLFDEMGGFDERFFLYLEDLDFSYRAHLSGWRSVYLADVKAIHIGGGVSRRVKALRLFYSLRSTLLYAFKHFSVLGAISVLMATLFIEPLLRSLHVLSNRSWSGFQETWAAYGRLWRWLSLWVCKVADK